MIDRFIEEKLQYQLTHFPAVTLLGARQTGKTTLALKIASNFPKPTLYLDLEKPSDAIKLHDPEFFLKQHLDKLVIIDEIQRMPEITAILRSIIDERKRNGDKWGQYLLLGSSSQSLLKQTSDSLAGRVAYLEIGGFSSIEIKPESFNDLWVKGGFPDSFLALNNLDSFSWRENLIKTYLEREIAILGYKASSATIGRLWIMLAHTQGEILNAAKLGASLGVSIPTVLRYLDILADLFLINFLRPWHQNHGKRLVKRPKVYIRDSGIAHCLLNLQTLDDILAHPIAGGSWEGFVLENIVRVIGNQSKIWFYRTSAGAEMDLIIETGSKKIGVEVKRSTSPALTKGGRQSKTDLNLDFVYIVYPGKDKYLIENDICVIPINLLLEEISINLLL